MGFNYAKLRGRIKELFKAEGVFAKMLGISRASLSNKLNNKTQFSQKEIELACLLLQIDQVEIVSYFFDPKG